MGRKDFFKKKLEYKYCLWGLRRATALNLNMSDLTTSTLEFYLRDGETCGSPAVAILQFLLTLTSMTFGERC